jgi:hypothetical protein
MHRSKTAPLFYDLVGKWPVKCRNEPCRLSESPPSASCRILIMRGSVRGSGSTSSANSGVALPGGHPSSRNNRSLSRVLQVGKLGRAWLSALISPPEIG